MQQQNYLPKKKKRMELWDWLLVIGITLAPMNYLRIWKVGPGELLCALWCIRYIGQVLSLSLKNLFVRFWMLFILAISIGATYGRLFYPRESNFGGLVTYVYFFCLSMGVYAGVRTKTQEQIRTLIYVLGIVAASWYMFLYVYSLTVNKFFFGIRMWYAGVRFSGGGKNPHQLGVLISTITFFNVFQVFDRELPWKKKLLPTVCIGFCAVIALGTKSSTLVFSLVITFVCFVYYMVLRDLKEKRQLWIASSVILIILAVFVGLFREKLVEMVYEWIASDDNGLGRLAIFGSFVETLQKGWLFGLGPGIHGMGGTIEYHNAYLEIFAMGGIVGFGIFLVFTVRLFRTMLSRRPETIFGVIPLYAYGLAGFSMRRLVFWGVVALLTAYAETFPMRDGAAPTNLPMAARTNWAGRGRR